MKALVVERHLSPGRRVAALLALLALGFLAQVFSFQVDAWGLSGTAWQGFVYRLGRSLTWSAPVALVLVFGSQLARALPNTYSRRWAFFALFAVLGFGGLQAWRASSVEVDGQRYWSLREDQMISLRSARNLAQGQDLSFNISPTDQGRDSGVIPESRVQGFSNPWWTLSMVGLATLPLPERALPAAVIVLALVICVFCLLDLLALAREFGLGHERRLDPGPHIRPAPIAYAALAMGFVLSSDLTYLGVLGVENPLLLLAMLRIWRLSREGKAIWGWALLMGLLRADGFVYVGMLAITCGMAQRQKNIFWKILIPGFLSSGLWMLWAWSYYGDPWPATVHLKAFAWPDRWKAGVDFLATYVSKHAFVLGMASFGFISAMWAGSEARQRFRLPSRGAVAGLGFLAAGNLLYVGYAGGDYAGCTRLLMPNSALALLFAVYAITLPWNRVWFALFAAGYLLLIPSDWGAVISQNDPIWWGHTRNAATFAPLAFAAIFTGVLMPPSIRLPGRPLALGILLLLSLPLYTVMGGRVVQINEPLVRQAQFLRDNVKEGESWAGVEVGILGYYSETPVIDLLGHTDMHIAKRQAGTGMLPGHNKYDFDYSLSQLKPCWLAEYTPEVQDVFLARDNYIASHGNPHFRLLFRVDLLAHAYAQGCFKELAFQNQERAVYRCKACRL